MARCKNIGVSSGSIGGTPRGGGGGDPPCRFTAIEKGKGKKVLAKKRKAGDREAEIADAVAAAAEAAQVGGRLGALRIGFDLTPAQRCVVLEIEQRHGSPPSTIMLGGLLVRIDV
jgi:hypothetical protein